MKRVLIISPHFPPINAPDHQRIRMMLAYLSEFGWQADIIAVAPDCVDGKKDPLLAQTIPEGCRIHWVQTLSLKYARLLGMRTLNWRSLWPIQKKVDQLLNQHSFDMIFFSTTIFPVLSLGPRWLKKFKIPYVVDLQDPWLKIYPYQKTPPGGWLKHQLIQMFAKTYEPIVMRYASHIMSVSDAYPKVLMQRYPFLSEKKFSVIPFGAGEGDVAVLKELNIKQSVFDAHDGKRHWVYLGRGGDDMSVSLNILFQAIQQDRLEKPHEWQDIRLHFIGTSYAQKDQAYPTILPIAKQYSLEDIVQEQTTRIPYFEGLQLLQDSEVVMVIGSDDSSYSPSKVYSCLLAARPIMALLHKQSLVVSILQRFQPGSVIQFGDQKNREDIVKETKRAIQELKLKPQGLRMPVGEDFSNEYGARKMTETICNIFNQTMRQAS